MGCTIDHLSVDHEIRILQAFTDARGLKKTAGERGILRRLDFDWPTKMIAFTWEHRDQSETLYFSLTAKTGPRNGGMREFFEVGEYRPTHSRPFPWHPENPRITRTPRAPRAQPDNQIIRDPSQWSAAVERIAALVDNRRFPEAEEQVRAILADAGPYGWRVNQLGEDLAKLACSLATDADRTSCHWLRDRAIHLLHAWGSSATSGGEGAAYAVEINAWKARLARVDD